VRSHLEQQREAGQKPNVALACREVSKALRGQLGRGTERVIHDSFCKLRAAAQRRELPEYFPVHVNNRWPLTSRGEERRHKPRRR
jgi:hypothetical protein